jgi:predicted DNA-binding transcriptional regulator AlpA
MGRLSLKEQGFIGHREIKQIAKVKSVAYFLAKNADFPKPLYKKNRSTTYDRAEVLSWFYQRNPELSKTMCIDMSINHDLLISRTEIGLMLGKRNTLFFCSTWHGFPQATHFNDAGFPILYPRNEVITWFAENKPEYLLDKESAKNKTQQLVVGFLKVMEASL